MFKILLRCTQQISVWLSTEALDCVLLGTHLRSCSLAVTLMYLNVVWEVEGGLRYWSDIEWWMMQCPYVILKTFKAPWNRFFFSSSPPPASFCPHVYEMSRCFFFVTIAAPVAIFTRFWFLLRYLSTHLCIPPRMWTNMVVPHLHRAWLWQGHVQFTLIWGWWTGRLQEEIEFAVTGLVRALEAGRRAAPL